MYEVMKLTKGKGTIAVLMIFTFL